MLKGYMDDYYCPACIKREEAETAAKERERELLAIEGEGLPDLYKTADFKHCPELKVVSAVKAWVQSPSGIILIRGQCGKGKTYLSAAAKKEFNRKGMKSIFVTEVDMIASIKDSFDKNSTVSELEAYKKYYGKGPLIIDDAGVDKNSEFVLSVWERIINTRYSYMRPTLINTNLNADDLKKHIGFRVWERIRESKKMYAFPDNAKNWRE